MIGIDELETHLGIADGTDTALLVELEASAVQFVQSYTHRYFGVEAERTEYLKGTDTAELWLEEAPASVTSVAYRSYPGGDETAVAAGDSDGFETRTDDPRLYRKGGAIWEGAYEWKVVYDRGYTEVVAAGAGTPADIAAPDDIRQAVKEITGFLYQEENRTDPGLLGETLGDYSYSKPALYAFANGMLRALPTTKATLDRYRRLHV